MAKLEAGSFQLISLHYPGSVDKQKNNNSSFIALIGIDCVLISKRKRRRGVREDSSLTATFSRVFTSFSEKGWHFLLNIIPSQSVSFWNIGQGARLTSWVQKSSICPLNELPGSVA